MHTLLDIYSDDSIRTWITKWKWKPRWWGSPTPWGIIKSNGIIGVVQMKSNYIIGRRRYSCAVVMKVHCRRCGVFPIHNGSKRNCSGEAAWERDRYWDEATKETDMGVVLCLCVCFSPINWKRIVLWKANEATHSVWIGDLYVIQTLCTRWKLCTQNTVSIAFRKKQVWHSNRY